MIDVVPVPPLTPQLDDVNTARSVVGVFPTTTRARVNACDVPIASAFDRSMARLATGLGSSLAHRMFSTSPPRMHWLDIAMRPNSAGIHDHPNSNVATSSCVL